MTKDKKGLSTGWKVGFTAIGVACIIFFSAYALSPELRSILNPTDTPPVVPGTYVPAISDPFNPSINFDEDDFTCVARGLRPGLSRSSAGNWDVIAAVSNVGDLTNARITELLDPAETTYYDKIAVTISAASIANDEDTYDDNYGPRAYGARDFDVTPGVTQTFDMFVTPNAAASLRIRNLATGAEITTANITTTTNFTVEMFLNNATVGCYDQVYMSYTNYLGTLIDVNLLMTFTNATGGVGATMAVGDLTATSATAKLGTISQLIFGIGSLGQFPITNHFNWGADATAAAADVIVSPNSVGIVARFGAAAI